MSPGTLEAHVEQAALDLFASMRWEVMNVQHEVLGEHGTLGRDTRGDMVLVRRLRAALAKLNPSLPSEAIEEALEELTRDRSAMTLVQTNRERKNALSADWGVIANLARGIRGLEKPVDITGVMQSVEKLLDESIDAQGYVIREPGGEGYDGRIQLGNIDFEALARFFAKSKQKASTADPTTAVAKRKVESLIRLNPTRTSLRDQLERLIADYNEGAHSTKQFFDELLAFMRKLEAEEKRAGAEGLDQERLAFYDLLLAPAMELSTMDRAAVKKVAEDLPKAVEKKLVIDWRKSQRARAA